MSRCTFKSYQTKKQWPWFPSRQYLFHFLVPHIIWVVEQFKGMVKRCRECYGERLTGLFLVWLFRSVRQDKMLSHISSKFEKLRYVIVLAPAWQEQIHASYRCLFKNTIKVESHCIMYYDHFTVLKILLQHNLK